MRFVIGLATGVALGVAASTLTAGRSSQDLRQEFDRIRSDIEKRDFEALGAHLEARFKDLQTGLEQRFADIKDAAAPAADGVDDFADEVSDTVDELEKEAVPA